MIRPDRLDRRRFLAAGLGFAGLAALGCGKSEKKIMEKPSEPRPRLNLTPAEEALVKGQNDFAFELYGKLRSTAGNQFFSPFSISMALGLAAAGARGDTSAEMAKVLHLPPGQAPAAFERIIRSLTDPRWEPDYSLIVGNALWGQKGYAWRPEYLEMARINFRAYLSDVDFAQPEAARQTINIWVTEQTAGRIPELFGPNSLTPDMRLVLTNAVYFKGLWSEPFKKENTKDDEFRPAPGKKIQVPMMHREGSYGFYQDESLKLLSLPYQGGDLGMTVLLPRLDDGLADLEKSLTADRLDDWLGKRRSQHLPVWLPRWKFTSSYGLVPPLRELGLKRAFDAQQADFSGMTSAERLFINDVVHKAFVEVNEEGTEAAAATGVAMTAGAAAPPPEPAEFKADHPFLFLIHDWYTGAILFLGRVDNPLA